MTHSFAAGLGSALANARNEEDRINLIRSFIGPVRFFPDNSGYFYVYDSKCVNIAHAVQKDLQGKNLWDYKDARENWSFRHSSRPLKKAEGLSISTGSNPGQKNKYRNWVTSNLSPGRIIL